MAAIDQPTVQGYINAGAAANTTTAKGRALEDLICYVFQQVPGIHLTMRNQTNVFLTEEVDVAFFNNAAADGLSGLPDVTHEAFRLAAILAPRRRSCCGSGR